MVGNISVSNRVTSLSNGSSLERKLSWQHRIRKMHINAQLCIALFNTFVLASQAHEKIDIFKPETHSHAEFGEAKSVRLDCKLCKTLDTNDLV